MFIKRSIPQVINQKYNIGGEIVIAIGIDADADTNTA